MKLMAKDNTVYNFSKDNVPKLTVIPGSEVTIQTLDCFANQLRKPEDVLDSLDWNQTNPTTGPIYVDGASFGDILKVTIKKIRLDEQGVAVAGKDMGTLGHLLKGTLTEIIPVSKGYANIMNQHKVLVKPMIGVIGVAPAGAPVNNGTPGFHGGNMDNTMIGEGASLYLDVQVPGALFALGDVHAVMGDGEIGVTGLEIPAEITVTLDLIKDKYVHTPILETADAWSVIVSNKSLDAAAEQATEYMFNFLRKRMDLEEEKIAILMSLQGNLEICQIVDPLKTVRFVIPKKITGEITI